VWRSQRNDVDVMSGHITTSRRNEFLAGTLAFPFPFHPSAPLRLCRADRHFKKYNDDTFCIATSTALA